MGRLNENNYKFLRKFSIRTRIITVLIISLLLYSFVILQLSIIFSKTIINDYVNDYVMRTQEEIVTGLQMLIDEANMITIRLRSNQEIYNIFRDTALTGTEKEQKVRSVLSKVMTGSNTISDINIITKAGDLYECYSYRSKIYEIDKSYLQKVENSINPVVDTILGHEDGSCSIPFGVKLRSFYTGEQIGYIVMYINEQALCDVYEKMVPDWGYSFVVSADDSIISHIEKNKIGKIILDTSMLYTDETQEYRKTEYNGEDVIVAASSLNDRMKSLGFDWKLVSIMKQKNLFQIVDKVKKYIVFFQMILFCLGAYISIYVSMKVIKPIANLRDNMVRFGRGNLSVLLNRAVKGDEIQELEDTFSKMVMNINDLIDRNNEEKEKQKEMELIALQAQINPHFLYNTLDAIGWIAKIKKQSDIELLVMSLAKFFRLSLHKGDKFITVEEEINLVQSFVQIEQMRSPGKFDMVYNVREEMKSLKMLKITLQPLVENAIKHGIGQKRGKGFVQINGYLDGSDMIFDVVDDGAGFDMQSGVIDNNNHDIRRSGYGIRNIDDRIKLEYGQSCGLTIESGIGKGTKAQVRIKIKQN